MPEEITYHYIPFAAKGDDAQRVVEGYVSSPDVDCDDQIVDQEWLKAELPAWLTRYGNIREQHDPRRAVGKAQAVDVQARPGPYLAAKIVDDDAWKKVKAGVYNGFSVGIKAPKIVYDGTAKNGRIAGGTLIEISIVDRPANDAAKFVVLKRAGEEEWMLGDGGPVIQQTLVKGGSLSDGEEAPTIGGRAGLAALDVETAQATERSAEPGQATTEGQAAPPAAAPLSEVAKATLGFGEPGGVPAADGERRPARIGAVMALLQDVQARLEALAGETDKDRDGDVDTPTNMEVAGPGGAGRTAAEVGETPDTPQPASAPLSLSFAGEADLAKFIDARVTTLLATRGTVAGAGEFVTKAAVAEPLAAIPEIAKLAGGIAKGLEALADRTKATAEDLAATKAAVAETQADLATVKALAQPVKGAVFAIEKGIGLEPDRVYRDGVIPEGEQRKAAAIKTLAGLSDQDRRLVASEVLKEMYQARRTP